MSQAYLPAPDPEPGRDAPDPTSGIDRLLTLQIQRNAADLLVRVHQPPIFKIDDAFVPDTQMQPMSPGLVGSMVRSILNHEQLEQFDRTGDVDVAYEIPGLSRYRVNIAMERGEPSITARTIPIEIKSLDVLKMPAIVRTFAHYSRGLVLVTGPTGSGKSTTMAAILNEVNETSARHIVTLEDPIEFVHKNKKSVFTQREIGRDTKGFDTGLRAALRQAPDIIYVGEMRDNLTISAALQAAETGHLVFGTLHTSSAVQTVSRILSGFEEGQKQEIRAAIAASLKAVVCQTLCEKASGAGVVPAMEIMEVTTAVRANLETPDGLSQVPTYIQSTPGNRLMDDDLFDLALGGKISGDTAILKANEKKAITDKLRARGLVD